MPDVDIPLFNIEIYHIPHHMLFILVRISIKMTFISSDNTLFIKKDVSLDTPVPGSK